MCVCFNHLMVTHKFHTAFLITGGKLQSGETEDPISTTEVFVPALNKTCPGPDLPYGVALVPSGNTLGKLRFLCLAL